MCCPVPGLSFISLQEIILFGLISVVPATKKKKTTKKNNKKKAAGSRRWGVGHECEQN